MVRAPYGDGLVAATDAARIRWAATPGFHALAATGAAPVPAGAASEPAEPTPEPVATRAAD